MREKRDFKTRFYAKVLDAARLATGKGECVDARAERTHRTHSRSPLHNESWYFNFFDHDQGLGGFTWIGKAVNQKLIRLVNIFFLPDGRIAARFGQQTLACHDHHMSCAGGHYRMIRPLEKWRIRSRGRVFFVPGPEALVNRDGFLKARDAGEAEHMEMKLHFEAMGPAYDSRNFDSASLARQMREKDFAPWRLAGLRRLASRHYEQSGTLKGRLSIGDQTWPINATGHRDHSWGVRDWAAADAWTWLSVQFKEGESQKLHNGFDRKQQAAKALSGGSKTAHQGRRAEKDCCSPGTLALNLVRVIMGPVDVYMGHILRDGVHHPLSRLKIFTEFEGNGLAPREIRFFIADTTGFSMEVKGEPVSRILLAMDQPEENPKHRAVVCEAMTRYTWQGQSALGIAEYQKRIR